MFWKNFKDLSIESGQLELSMIVQNYFRENKKKFLWPFDQNQTVLIYHEQNNPVVHGRGATDSMPAAWWAPRKRTYPVLIFCLLIIWLDLTSIQSERATSQRANEPTSWFVCISWLITMKVTILIRQNSLRETFGRSLPLDFNMYTNVTIYKDHILHSTLL